MLHKKNWKYSDETIEGLVNKTGKFRITFTTIHRSKDLPQIKAIQIEV